MNGVNFSFLKKKGQLGNFNDIFLSPTALYFLTLHFRFSSLFYSSQLVDIFSYEIPMRANSRLSPLEPTQGIESVVVYNVHVLNSQTRFFLFIKGGVSTPSKYNTISSRTRAVQSLSELFSASNWLEREASELSGIFFLGKKDIRNLMLQYGDSTTPFRKAFPTVGVSELFYNPTKDTLIQNPVSLQI